MKRCTGDACLLVLRTGDHVTRPSQLGAWITHHGIVDQDHVIHATPDAAGVTREPITSFARGATVDVVARASNAAEAKRIADAARAQLGRPFHLLTANCEHLAHGARGPARSPTIERLLALFK